jgi:AraC-like DNA-binding protein
MEEAAFNRNPPVSISQLLAADSGPCKRLSSMQMNIIKICIDRVQHYLKHTEHRLRKELVINTFYTFILETINIFFEENSDKQPVETSVKKTHIQKFMELLIVHGEKEHSPAFYADKLCISVQYLSLILKEISGRTANVWISNFVITRAKAMLRKPDITIQQITETLNFSDQSSFGKFFKKHVGISPKKYRESHMTI